jgi:hypothetical protein
LNFDAGFPLAGIFKKYAEQDGSGSNISGLYSGGGRDTGYTG